MSRCYSFRNAFYPPIRPEPLGPSGVSRTEELFEVKMVKKAIKLKLKLLNMILIHHDLIYFYLMEHRGISGDFFMMAKESEAMMNRWPCRRAEHG